MSVPDRQMPAGDAGLIVICAGGRTVIINEVPVPVQPSETAVGVTVIVAVAAEDPLLVAVNVGSVVPVPVAPRPIEGLLLVQLNVEVEVLENVSEPVVTVVPLQ